MGPLAYRKNTPNMVQLKADRSIRGADRLVRKFTLHDTTAHTLPNQNLVAVGYMLDASDQTT